MATVGFGRRGWTNLRGMDEPTKEGNSEESGTDARAVAQLVVVGSSAGGIEALSTLLSTLPADFPAPIVVAQHIDRRRQSHLGEILARCGPLPVRTVAGMEGLENGVVYVVPADRDVEVTDHSVVLRSREQTRPKPSVDLLLASAARIYRDDLIAVVLTGTGSDGAAGAEAVKSFGGTVIVQNPATAPFPGMPMAVPPTAVDMVAEIEAIGPLLGRLLRGAKAAPLPEADDTLLVVLDRVRERGGLDFSAYKRPTIARRLQRRMAAIGVDELGDYRRYIDQHPDEVQRLVDSFLIKVTQFFRDPDLFDHLRDQILPGLVAEARDRGELRLWSAGCATGEEAYTLSMLVADLIGDEAGDFPVRIFATDVSADAIEFARRGIYPPSTIEGMPPDLLERHFLSRNDAYEVRKSVRSQVVLGQHDLAHRAPFPRIDLVLCRNVLIYFLPELQRRALQLFTFSLRRDGFLALGRSETVRPLPEFFAVEHPRLKLFRRIGDAGPTPSNPKFVPTSAVVGTDDRRGEQAKARQPMAPSIPPTTREQTLGQQATRLLDGVPFGVLTADRTYAIRLINGAARRLLGIHGAAVGDDLVHRIASPLAGSIRAALDAAFRGERTITLHAAPDDVVERAARDLRITCYPVGSDEVQEPAELAVIAIEEVTELVRDARQANQARDDLQVVIETQETRTSRAVAEVRALREANQLLSIENARRRGDNEGLLIANEEAQAAAEEIETLNEELETLNEELQATVEELTTTNDELHARSLDLHDMSATQETERRWLSAVLAGIGDAVLVVDRDGQSLLTNAAYRRVFGDGSVRPEDESGVPLPPDASPERRSAVGEGFGMTFTAVDPDGLRRWFEAEGQPLQHDGVAAGIVVIRDITDRNQRQMQDEWLGIASHQLRTPLTALQGALQLADRRHDDPERVRRYLGQALGQSRRLGALVTALVDTVRVQGGHLSVRKQPIDLNSVAADAVETARLLAREQAIVLEKTSEPLVIDGDPARLEQVLIGLLSNAVTYAPGTEQIVVRLAQVEGTATVEVRDAGDGIPSDDLDRIFLPYYRTDVPGAAPGSGLGLGLFLARELVAAHAGTIAVRSNVGEGSVFTIRLPLTAGAAIDELATLAVEAEGGDL